MFLGNERARRVWWTGTKPTNGRKIPARRGLEENPRTRSRTSASASSSWSNRQGAWHKDVRLLILDEPTSSSLNETDAKKLLDLLLSLRKDKGVTSIIIPHKLNEIAYVADKITILRDGATIETLDKATDQITEERIIRGMVGRELTDRFPKRQSNPGGIALEVEHWTVYHPLYTERKVVDDVSINVRRAEVVALRA
jgi:putative multiple sugar transport system ATP-binding protein